jgi:hypothetical protein
MLLISKQLQEITSGNQLIVRVDRTEPSKNIVRVSSIPPICWKCTGTSRQCHVSALLFLPDSSRSIQKPIWIVDAAAGRSTPNTGTVMGALRVIVGEDYAAQFRRSSSTMYCSSPIADGMNLVARSPIVNIYNGA